MDKPQNNRNKNAVILISITVILLLLCLTGFKIMEEVDRYFWTKQTTPLTTDQRMRLCDRLELAKDDNKCADDAVIYTPDFFPAIKRYLNSQNPDGVTYQDVHDLLRAYYRGCDPYPAVGKQSFSCSYDLRGDGRNLIGAVFDENGQLVRMRNTPGDSQ